jgi:hypothetical protein
MRGGPLGAASWRFRRTSADPGGLVCSKQVAGARARTTLQQSWRPPSCQRDGGPKHGVAGSGAAVLERGPDGLLAAVRVDGDLQAPVEQELAAV